MKVSPTAINNEINKILTNASLFFMKYRGVYLIFANEDDLLSEMGRYFYSEKILVTGAINKQQLLHFLNYYPLADFARKQQELVTLPSTGNVLADIL